MARHRVRRSSASREPVKALEVAGGKGRLARTPEAAGKRRVEVQGEKLHVEIHVGKSCVATSVDFVCGTMAREFPRHCTHSHS